jgi:putative hydrolase of the HAD superfamily
VLKAVLFDVDDTLMPDEAAADAAILAVAQHARAIHNTPPEDLRVAVRRVARARFRAHPLVPPDGNFDISSWEALTSTFSGDDPVMTELRAWAPQFRRDVWFDALAECGVADAMLAEQLACLYPTERRNRYAPYADVLPVLDGLTGRYQLGAVTNGPCDLQHQKLERSGLDRYFPVQVISREVGVRKPDPRIFEIALDRLGVAAAESVFIGDSPKHDIAGAHAAGMKAIWLRRDGAAGTKPVAQGGGVESDTVRADATITGLAELPAGLAALATGAIPK